MSIMTYIGHHGSSSERCKKIIKEGFNPSGNGWLGPGVYFFQEDNQLARSWAKYKYGNCKVEVIECDLNVDSSKLLDISDPKSELSKKVNEFKEQFLRYGIQKERLIKMNDTDFDGKVLDMICQKDKYDMVRNFTHTRTDLDRQYKNYNSNISNCVELCVRNLQCIKVHKI